MTRTIIDEFDDCYKGISVNTFWMGKQEGVQFTSSTSYTQMTREEATIFLKTALERLKKQVRDDKINPPWWQELIK